MGIERYRVISLISLNYSQKGIVLSQLKHRDPRRALVLFSGGQDSTTVLAHALQNHDYVETIGFDYGQRHRIELSCRTNVLERIGSEFPLLAERLGPDTLLDMSTFAGLSQSALTDTTALIETGPHGLPTSFVPGRNLFFFQYAAVIAYNRDMGHLIGGMCETDYSGYPDCRDETLKALNVALNLGMETDFQIITPLMRATKAESWHMADELGGAALITLIREETHSCYNGVRDHLYDWGYGCATCPACLLRAKGYEEWRAS